MTTRNFLEGHPNFFYPRVDFAGELTGVVGMEFPIYNGLTALLTWMLGLDSNAADVVARLLNMGLASLGVYYFYKSIVEFVDKDIAFPAAFILLCSIWMLYSRKIMPDTFASGIGLVAIYYGLRFASRGGAKNIIKYTCLMSFAVLSKISVAFMVIYPFLILFRHQANFFKRSLLLAAATGGVLGVVVLWYFWWVPTLNTRFGFEHFFMGRSLVEGWLQITQNFPKTVERFTKVSLGYSGAFLLILGLVYSIFHQKRWLILSFLAGFVAFLPFVIKSGFNFFHHNYYVIPFVPVLCVVAGYGVSVLRQTKMKWLLVVLLLIFFLEHGSRFIRDQRGGKDHLLSLEVSLDKVSSRHDLILINSGDDPTPMYFAHRKGWIAYGDQIREMSRMNDLVAKGLKFIVLIRQQRDFVELPKKFPMVFENEYFLIYKAVSEGVPAT